MTTDVAVRCRCGAVRGVAREVSPKTVNRARCYCNDCRAFLHWLGRDEWLDERGGTEIIQLARARFDVADGVDRLRCLRLTPKGMHRWYADCCRTPLGNTLPALPFIGIAHGAFETTLASEDLFGPLLVINVKSALGARRRGEGLTLAGVVHVTGLLASWALHRLGHPTPLFDRSNRPIVAPQVLSAAERQALRAHPRA